MGKSKYADKLKRLVQISPSNAVRTKISQTSMELFKSQDVSALEEALAVCVDRDTSMDLRELIARVRWKQACYEDVAEHFLAVADGAAKHAGLLKIGLAALIKLGRFGDVADIYHANQEFFIQSLSAESQAHVYQDAWLSMAALASNRLATDLQRTRRDAPFLQSFLGPAARAEAPKPVVAAAAEHAQRMCAEESRAHEWDGAHPRHIALAGTSYCGSTILSAVLGSLPGCENIGESYWLTRRKQGAHPALANEVDFERENVMYCRSCGPECATLTTSFRLELSRDPTLWYRKIAQQCAAEMLISSDKNHRKLVCNDPLLRMDTVVLFKSPEQHWWSNLRKIQSQAKGFNPLSCLEEFERSWTGEYGVLLDSFTPSGKTIFLCFDAFCEAPARHLKQLCEHLSLPFKEDAVTNVRRAQHFLGGNASVSTAYQQQPNMQVRPLEATGLSNADKAKLASSTATQDIWTRCMTRYRQDFD